MKAYLSIPRVLLLWVVISTAVHGAQIRMFKAEEGNSFQVLGDKDDEWRFQTSEDLVSWTNTPGLGAVFSGGNDARSIPLDSGDAWHRFTRAVKTDGLFDTNLLRTISLTFTNANWQTKDASRKR